MADKDDSNWGKHLGIGFQVLVGVLLGMVVGKWLDRRFGWAPWGMVIGMSLGLASGMYMLIREGLRANRDEGPKRPGPGA
ncbi:MAG: hypothetical protein JWO87_655 [Phycisphaerales bacterium]|jgi:F0F1-type ATP synthase assembly protein I|nr:hypothetical protein [Phycisphaerales bacterium]MDB5298992.1 hypothetical protein [Phycisphaerales bacterium]MDB5305505.1 hypothetical protein [Phycisphaerales bacterium]